MKNKNIFFDKYTLIVFALFLIFYLFNKKAPSIPVIQAEAPVKSIIIILVFYAISIIIAFLYKIAKTKGYF